MTYNSKKDYLKNSDLQRINEKLMVNMENDDEDIYISERSSVSSSNDMNQMLTPTVKRLSTPTTPSILSIPQKQPHTLRYPYNEIPENGVPTNTHFQVQRKEENKKKKDLRKAPADQKKLVTFYGTKTGDLSDHYYPSWYSNKINNPDWNTRHRQPVDNQLIPYESLDSSQNAQQSVLTTLPLKPRQHPRNTRHNHVPINHSNHDKQRLDHSENTPILSTHLTSHENHENNYQKQGTSPSKYISFKDSDHDEHRIQPNRRTISRQRRTLKTENDWTEHHLQSLSNGKSSPDSTNLIITSNSLGNRSKNRAKLSDKSSVLSDFDENAKYRHQHSHHNSPSIPSQQTYHHQHQSHLHIRRRPPSGTHLDSDIHVVDVTFKRTDRPSYIQPIRESFPSPIQPIHNETPYFPPIMRDNYQPKTYTPRFPNEYYGTLARQTHGKDWEEPLDIPKLYKPDSQTRFYDRYLHNVVDKRLAA